MKHLWTQEIQLLCEDKKGYISLMAVIIIFALTLLIASAANLFSIGESGMGLQESQSWHAYYLANACAEDALIKLKNDLDYSGNETLNFDNGNCIIEPLEGTGDRDRIIKVSGIAFGQFRKIKIEIDKMSPRITIKSWLEVADF